MKRRGTSRRADQVEIQQVVERVQALRLATALRSRRRDPARTARRRRPRRRGTRATAAESDSSSPAIAPLTAAGRPPSTHRLPVESGGQLVGGRPPELLQIERVAAAVAIDRRHRLAHRPGPAAAPPPASLSCCSSSLLTGGVATAADEALVRLAGPEAERQQDRRIRLAADQRRDQLDRGAVAPVQVVEHQHERLPVGDQPEQAPDGAVGPVALVGDRRRLAVGRAQGGQDLTELGSPGPQSHASWSVSPCATT